MLKNKLLKRSHVFMVVFFALAIAGCKKTDFTIATTSDANIADYLRNDPADFSDFYTIISRAGAAGYLNAYGAYTVFAPTNTAVKAWLLKKGKSSVNDIDSSVLRDVVRFHLIKDTLTTSVFTDGKLPNINVYGQFLTTSVGVSDGVAGYIINRQAKLLQGNIVTGNGIIHVIDQVLEPATLTLAQQLEQNSDYSIFTQALKETGYYDTLNTSNIIDTTRQWLTVIAQTDAVFKAIGIADYAALKAQYSNTGNPRDHADSLHLYIAYHILTGIKFLADIISAPSHTTLAPLEVVTAKLDNQTVLLNEDVFNGVTEPGIALDRTNSDYIATNGALHAATGNLQIKVRKPAAVYWDVADQPEIRQLVSVFRKPGQVAEFSDPAQFSGIKWQGGTIKYNVTATTSTDYYCYYDFLTWYMRTAVTQWVEFTTPFLVKGKYKVWICFRRARAQTIQVLVDDQPLSKLVDVSVYYPTTLDDDNAEATGVKRFVVTPSTNANHIGKLVGVVDIATSDRHKLKFVALTNESGSANTFNLDMVHFIPADQEQKWPRFQRDGTATYQ
ncbi:fasciclin domain-containing protein [Filimonas lacunae]|nr:fasciclin domain-containing protein [Filimonas lacunae]